MPIRVTCQLGPHFIMCHWSYLLLLMDPYLYCDKIVVQSIMNCVQCFTDNVANAVPIIIHPAFESYSLVVVLIRWLWENLHWDIAIMQLFICISQYFMSMEIMCTTQGRQKHFHGGQAIPKSKSMKLMESHFITIIILHILYNKLFKNFYT